MLKNLLERALIAAPTKTWPTYDNKLLTRSDFLTSSEVGSCIRKAYFGKHPEEYPTSDDFTLNGFAHRGHAVEAWLVETLEPLKAEGYTLEYMGDDQRSFYDDETGLSGTPDGLMTTPEGEKILLEIKSIDPRFNKSNLPKRGHPMQTAQNMYLVEKCLGIEIDYGILFYLDASNLMDTTEFRVKKDEAVLKDILARADRLWGAKDPNELEAEGVFNSDCDYCGHTAACNKFVDVAKVLAAAGASAAPFLRESGFDQSSELTPDEFVAVEGFLDAYEGEKNYKAEKEQFEQEVKRLVTERGVLATSRAILSSKLQQGNKGIDKKTLEKWVESKGGDMSPFEKRGKPFARMTVKLLDEEDTP